MKKYKFSLLVFTALSAILVSSCNPLTPNYSLTYTPAPPVKLRDFKQSSTLFISNILDERTGEAKISSEPNADPYILIPLWPYSHSDINPIIRYSFFQAPLPEAIKRLVVTDIKASDIFQKVVTTAYNADTYMSSEDELNAYRLSITLKDAVWSRNLTSYGLSYPGTFLWVIGFPVSYGEIYMNLNVEFYAPITRKLIAKKTIRKSINCTEWIYDQINYKPPISEFKLTEIFPEITKEIRTFLIDSLYKYRKFKAKKLSEFVEKK